MNVGDRRAMMMGIAAMSGIVVFGRALPASYEWTARLEESATGTLQRLERARHTANGEAGVSQDHDRLRELLVERRGWLISSASLPLASATLARRITDAAEAAGASLSSVQQERPKHNATPVVVRARFSMSGDLASIVDCLATLESGDPMIVVRQLSIVQPDIALPASRIENVRAEVVVEALALIEPRKSE